MGHLVVTVYVKHGRAPLERIEATIGHIARAVYDQRVLHPGAPR
jgi:hypothetical protein